MHYIQYINAKNLLKLRGSCHHQLVYRVVHSNVSVRFLKKISDYNEATETCNTAIEREFCWLSEDIFKNCEKSFYEAQFSFFWQLAELTKKPIFKEMVNLR